MATLAESKRAPAIAADEAALRRFRTAVEKVVADHDVDLDRAAKNAGTEAAQLWPLVHLLALLARDKIDDGRRAANFLHATVGKTVLAPPLRELTDGLAHELDLLQDELDTSTVQLAVDLAAVQPAIAYVPRRDAMREQFQARLYPPDLSLARAGGSLLGGAIDATVLASLAQRMFAKQIARLGTSALVSQLDGPLPGFADLLAITFAGWTAWDIAHMRRDFQEAVMTSIKNQLDGQRAAAREYTASYGKQLVKEAAASKSAVVAAATGTTPIDKGTP